MSHLRAFLLVMASVPGIQLYAASLTGTWEGQLRMLGGSGEMRKAVRLMLVTNGSKLTGTLAGDGTTTKLLDGMVSDDEVSFTIASGASDVSRFEFHGRLTGDLLTLAVTGRVKGTEKALKLGEGSFKRRR
jgi:hypothetical protein